MVWISKVRNGLSFLFSLLDPSLNKALPKLTGKQPDDFVGTAEAMLGKRGNDFGWNVDWCCFFICWAALKSSAFPLPASSFPTTLATRFVQRNCGTFYYFRDQTYDGMREEHGTRVRRENCVKSSRDSFVPRKGDIVLFLWKEHEGIYSCSHAGIVKAFQGGKLITIEGNTAESHTVEIRERDYDSQVLGFLRAD